MQLGRPSPLKKLRIHARQNIGQNVARPHARKSQQRAFVERLRIIEERIGELSHGRQARCGLGQAAATLRFAFRAVVQLQIPLGSRKRRADIVGKRDEVLTKCRTMGLLGNVRVALRIQLFVYRPRNAGNTPCGEIHRNAFVASAFPLFQETRHGAQLALVAHSNEGKHERCQHGGKRNTPSNHESSFLPTAPSTHARLKLHFTKDGANGLFPPLAPSTHALQLSGKTSFFRHRDAKRRRNRNGSD